uniref:Uncharacterized protein n=1 Tax=Moniliophthora roreri TaxID=221103 RepID=A0A0W0GF29_MONRR
MAEQQGECYMKKSLAEIKGFCTSEIKSEVEERREGHRTTLIFHLGYTGRIQQFIY